MSFKSNSNNPLAGVEADQRRQSGYREAEPVPLQIGAARIGVKWLCEQFDQWEKKGKKIGFLGVGGREPPSLFMSLAGVVCLGEVAGLGRIWVDGQEVGTLSDAWNGSGYAETAITEWPGGPGKDSFVRVYRGSETQAVDATLESLTGQDHPAYRGTCWVLLRNVNVGQLGGSVPNVEIEVFTYSPPVGGYAPGQMSGYDLALGGQNPIAAAYGILTHRRGGAEIEELIDAQQWGELAAALYQADGGNGHLNGIHPVYSALRDAQNVLADLAPYFEGFFVVEDGQIRVSLLQQAGSEGQAPVATLAAADHVEPPKPKYPTRDETPGVIAVTYTSYPDYEVRAAVAQAPRAPASTGYRAPRKVERPFLRGDDSGGEHHIPNSFAQALAEQAGLVDISGESRILRSRAINGDGDRLTLGDIVEIEHENTGIEVVARITAIEDDPAREYVKLGWIRERDAWAGQALEVADPLTPPVDPFDPETAEIAVDNIQPVFLPSGFGLDRQVIILAERPAEYYAGVNVWLATAGAGPYQELGAQRFWATRVLANETINSSATELEIEIPSGGGLDFGDYESQNDVGQADDALLAYFPATGEFASIGTITPVSAGVYDLTLLRGRRGTAADAVTDEDTVWIFLRAEIEPWAHREFSNVRAAGVYDTGVAEKYFKVQPFTGSQTGEAQPDGGVSIVLPDIVEGPVTVGDDGVPTPGGSVAADDVSYDNGTSGLAATDVQAALDEIVGSLADVATTGAAIDVAFDSSGTDLVSTDVQAALEEIDSILGNKVDVDDLAAVATSGDASDLSGLATVATSGDAFDVTYMSGYWLVSTDVGSALDELAAQFAIDEETLLGRDAGAGTGEAGQIALGDSLEIDSGVLDTVQDIQTTATPQFSGLAIGHGETLATLKVRIEGLVQMSASAMANVAGITDSSSLLQLASEESTQLNLGMTQASSAGTGIGPQLFMRRARGSSASLDDLLTNDQLGGIAFLGYNGSAFTSQASYQVFAPTDWSVSNRQTAHRWFGTSNASTTNSEWMRLINGSMLLGGTSTAGLSGAGSLRVFSTTEATASAGALIVDGGILAKKRIYTSDAIQTGAPSGGTAALWKFGTYDATVPTPTGRVRIEVGGAAYCVPAEAI